MTVSDPAMVVPGQGNRSRKGVTMWSDVQQAAPSASWVELAKNGWGALMGWAAEKNVRRHPTSDAGRTVTGYIEQAGERKPFEEPSRPLTGT